MARFHELTVTDVQKTIRNAVVVTLEPNSGDVEAFDYIQGQYLTFRRTFDGQELRRSYSICSGKNEGVLQIGIKQVDGGTFSTWANEDLRPGSKLEAMAPAGSFYSSQDDNQPNNYLAFAGGSGITPILSILKTVLVEEPQSTFTLVYANQGVNTIMFREELEDLKNTFMERLSIVHILENDTSNADLFIGRMDAKKCQKLFKSWVNTDGISRAYICGPEPMMLAISEALKDQGIDAEKIRTELFAGTQTGLANRRAKSKFPADAGDKTKLTVTLDGASLSFDCGKDIAVLDAALGNALDVPFACKAGVCSSCKCKVTEGEVEMIANHSLEDYEVEKGYVLACQSYVLSDKVSVDFDQ